MKKISVLFLMIVSFALTSAGQVNSRSTYVQGYVKSNGTYVQGYNRTAPNNTINDNYSTYPNYNPYTGKQGIIQPTYSLPTYSMPTYTYPIYSTPTYNSGSYYTPSQNYYYWR
jgi:hypothetical protein